MSLDWSATHAILKEMYPAGSMEEAGYRGKPFLGLVKKNTEAGGDQEKIPVVVSSVQGASATFASAQAQAEAVSSTVRAFEVTTVQNYALARITGKMIRATRGNKAAFVKALDFEIQQALNTWSKRAEMHLYRVGDGTLGVVGTSGISTTSLTLAHWTQAACMEPYMELGSALNNASAIQTGTATITGINRSTGVLTTDSNWTTQIVTVADAHNLFPVGDYVTASDRLCLKGLESWVPATAPTAGDSHFGVDRSVDTDRLAGVRLDGSALTIEEALINGQSMAAANSDGRAVDHCFLNNFNYRRLLNALSAKKSYRSETLKARGAGGNELATVSYSAIVIDGDQGPIKVVPCPLIPYDVAWMTALDTWTLYSMGAAPGILEEDGQMIQRVYNADAYEVRVGAYYQLATDNPAATCRIKLY